MKLRHRQFAAMIAGAMLFTTAIAQTSTVWYAGAVQLVYPMNDGSFAIGVSAVLPGCSSSGSGSYMWVTAGQNAVTAAGANSMLATVLTAFAAGRSISVAYDNSTAYCYVNRLLIQ